MEETSYSQRFQSPGGEVNLQRFTCPKDPRARAPLAQGVPKRDTFMPGLLHAERTRVVGRSDTASSFGPAKGFGLATVEREVTP